jgi:cation/acetate symporter
VGHHRRRQRQPSASARDVTKYGDGILQLAELRLHTGHHRAATPEIAGLPYVISGLVAAGGLAAALSTADGLLLAIANALSHDIYYKMIDPNGVDTGAAWSWPARLLILVAILAPPMSPARGGGPASSRWWPGPSRWRRPACSRRWSWASGGRERATTAGAWGMIAGFGLCMYYLIATEFYGPWVKQSLSWMGDINIVKIRGRDVAYIWGINNISVGIFGIPAAFIAMLIAGWVTKPASAEMQDFIDSIRVPAGSVRNAEAAH